MSLAIRIVRYYRFDKECGGFDVKIFTNYQLEKIKFNIKCLSLTIRAIEDEASIMSCRFSDEPRRSKIFHYISNMHEELGELERRIDKN